MIGTKGTCDVGGHIIRGENAWRFGKRGAKDPYQQEHDDLFAAIRNDTPYSEAENGAKSTMTSILGGMATYSGKIIEWEKAIDSQLDYFPKTLAWDAEPPVKPNADGMYQIARAPARAARMVESQTVIVLPGTGSWYMPSAFGFTGGSASHARVFGK